MRQEIIVEEGDKFGSRRQMVEDGVALAGEPGLAGDQREIGSLAQARDISRFYIGDEQRRRAQRLPAQPLDDQAQKPRSPTRGDADRNPARDFRLRLKPRQRCRRGHCPLLRRLSVEIIGAR